MTDDATTQSPEQELFKSKNLAPSINEGSVAVEMERAVAEAQGKMVIAKRFPRDEVMAYKKIMDSCKRLSMAEIASFSYPRGGSTVTGPTIRLAEELARCWGNIEYGIRELSQRPGYSEMEAWAWDVETNTTSKQTFTVRHIRDKKGGGQVLTDQRDLYEITANMGARRLRARIMSVLPPDLIEAAVAQCNETIKSGGEDVPLADRVRIMVGRFGTIGIELETLVKYLGHGLDNVLPDEFLDLHNIFASLKNGMSKPSDWFGEKTQEADRQIAAFTEPEKKKKSKAKKKAADPIMDDTEEAF